MNGLNMRIASGIDLATSKDIPAAGEFWIDTITRNGKRGDGKTPMFELPWITYGVDYTSEPSRKYKMTDSVKNFIEQYIDLIEQCRFDEIYFMINQSSPEFVRDFTNALLEAGINPTPHLTTIPRCIQELLFDNLDNKLYIHDYVTYTKADIDATCEMVKQYLVRTWGIPDNILKVGG